MTPNPTLYLLASEDGFRLLHGSGPGLADLSQAKASDFPDVAHSFGDERGRNHAAGIQFGNDGDRTDAEIERPRLAAHAVKALAVEWAKGDHKRIVISAGPKMLGALRAALPKQLAGSVAAELHKDLMKVAAHDLPEHFKKDVPL